MKKSIYTVAALLSFLLGVGLFLVWQPGWEVMGLMCLFVFLCLCFAWLLGRFMGQFANKPYKDWSNLSRPYFILMGLMVVFFLFGLARATLSVHRTQVDDVDFYNGQEVSLEGIVRQVDARQNQVKYTVEVLQLSLVMGDPLDPLASWSTPVNGEVLVSLNRYPRYNYGDKLHIVGELREPGVIDDFNYGNYLSRYGLYSVMYRPYAEKLDEGFGNRFWAGMVSVQDQFLSQIGKLFPEPYASFEAGLLVGARKGIPEELMEQFNITGLTHIIAISGYNITIIIVFVMWLLRRLPRRVQFVVAVGCIVLFTLFVGASPAVVRASIMGILGLLALQTGRQSNIHLTVLFTAFLMVLWNPKILWWDVGFQLSFAAVLGLIYIAPWFDGWAKKLPEAFGIREAIQMTLAAQVTALPIIIYNFGRLSIISPISNLLVAFAIPPAMALGFAGVLLSFIWFPLGLPFAYGAYLVLAYIIKVIELTAAIPYASVDLPGMKLWMMLGYYVVLVGFLVWRAQKNKLQSVQL